MLDFMNSLISLGYNFFVYPKNDTVVVEVSFSTSCFGHGDEIVPPKEIPDLPYKVTLTRENYDDFYISFRWSFVLAECPAEPPRQ